MISLQKVPTCLSRAPGLRPCWVR